jgi:hypothetical protein
VADATQIQEGKRYVNFVCLLCCLSLQITFLSPVEISAMVDDKGIFLVDMALNLKLKAHPLMW